MTKKTFVSYCEKMRKCVKNIDAFDDLVGCDTWEGMHGDMFDIMMDLMVQALGLRDEEVIEKLYTMFWNSEESEDWERFYDELK